MNQNFNQGVVQQGRPLMVTLVPDILNIDGITINPGSAMFFLNESMTTLKMRSRDFNGFMMPERVWELKETTPPPQTQVGQFATKEEFDNLNAKMDKLLSAFNEFAK